MSPKIGLPRKAKKEAFSRAQGSPGRAGRPRKGPFKRGGAPGAPTPLLKALSWAFLGLPGLPWALEKVSVHLKKFDED